MDFNVSIYRAKVFCKKTHWLLTTGLLALFLACVSLLGVQGFGAQQAFAYEAQFVSGQWIQSGDKWWFSYDEATRLATGNEWAADIWANIGGKTYHFDDAGWMNAGWAPIDREWYWFGADGVLKTGWVSLSGAWYYLDPVTGVMATDWVQAPDGQLYYFGDSGVMQANRWVLDDGLWYWLSPSGALAKGWLLQNGSWYLLDTTTGVMHTGLTKAPDGNDYFFEASGIMQANRWVFHNNAWYWLTSSGAVGTGWLAQNGAWYLLDPITGVMQTGWAQAPDGNDYYFAESGIMQANCWIDNTYWVDAGGKKVVNAWVDGGRYYVGVDGARVRNPGKVDGGNNQDRQDGGQGGDQGSSQKKTQYNYELQVLNKHGLYSNNDIVLYVKTDNPNPKGFYIGTPTKTLVSMYLPYFDDLRLKDTGSERWEKQPLASGTGYVAAVQVEQAGTHDLVVYEYKNGDYYHPTKTDKLTTVEVLDYATEEAKWMDSMIAKYTTSDMTPVEKMQTLCRVFAFSGKDSLFRYNPVIYRNGKNANWEYARLVSEKGPYFKTYHWDSYESPAALCKFAERIGGFENINNCFDDFDPGTPGWSKWHWFCKATYQGKEYAFEACPMASTFVVEDINYLDI